MYVMAHAKINLCLEVLGRRVDGYHDIATVIHAVELADCLTIEPADNIHFTCEPALALGDDNLVIRAARLLQEHTYTNNGAALHLKKRIPVAAGLGGGSSDAAAALLGLSKYWKLGLSQVELYQLGLRLGSDVPFFLKGGCALAEGRGIELTPLPSVTNWWTVMLCPAAHIDFKTAFMYGLLSNQDYTDGTWAQTVAGKLKEKTLMIHDVGVAANTFERVESQIFSKFSQYRSAFLGAGAPFVKLAGSGPSLFTLVDSREAAEQIAGHLRDLGVELFIAKLVGRSGLTS